MTAQTATGSRVPAHHLLYLAIVAAVLVWSGIGPEDRLTWFLEVAPVLIAAPLLIASYRSYRLTELVYALILIHAIILIVGGHYTYAKVPLGFWFAELLELERNHYDRLGHIAQGFVPALVAREILVRSSPLAGSRWLPFLVVCFCLAFSAFYELIEWWAAVFTAQGAQAFLGTQGDVWDTQWDMFLCLCGAIVALLTLSRLHDRQLARLPRG